MSKTKWIARLFRSHDANAAEEIESELNEFYSSIESNIVLDANRNPIFRQHIYFDNRQASVFMTALIFVRDES